MNFFLTEQQIRLFRTSGFFKSPHLLDNNSINELKGNISELYKNPTLPFRKNAKDEVFRIDNLINRGKIFKDLFTSSIILDPLESLLGPNIEYAINRQNNVNLNRGCDQEPRLHRDVLQWSRAAITVIVYLEESTVENGCTLIIPGTQYFPFVSTKKNCFMEEHPIYHDILDQTVPIPMKAGGILFIDCLVMHTVGKNQTDSTRLSMSAAYHSVDEISGNIEDKYKLLVRGENLRIGNFEY